MAEKRGRKVLNGVVIGNKMDKTVKVVIERLMKEPLYKKYIKRTTKLLVHDEKNECKVGDLVEIKEVRPISKRKHFLVTKILKRGEAEVIENKNNEVEK